MNEILRMIKETLIKYLVNNIFPPEMWQKFQSFLLLQGGENKVVARNCWRQTGKSMAKVAHCIKFFQNTFHFCNDDYKWSEWFFRFSYHDAIVGDDSVGVEHRGRKKWVSCERSEWRDTKNHRNSWIGYSQQILDSYRNIKTRWTAKMSYLFCSDNFKFVTKESFKFLLQTEKSNKNNNKIKMIILIMTTYQYSQ